MIHCPAHDTKPSILQSNFFFKKGEFQNEIQQSKKRRLFRITSSTNH